MSTDRSAAVALAAGTLAGLVTMALHPTGTQVVREAAAGAPGTRVVAVHALALVAQPLLLAGYLGFTLRLRARRDLAVGAYVTYAVAALAVVIAGVASGFVAPAVVADLAGADAPTRAAALAALRYTGLLNQAFATVHVGLAGVALMLWSAALLAGRELGRALPVAGLLLGVALVAVVVTGRPPLDVHGFGLVVLGEGVWAAWVAVRLWREGH